MCISELVSDWSLHRAKAKVVILGIVVSPVQCFVGFVIGAAECRNGTKIKQAQTTFACILQFLLHLAEYDISTGWLEFSKYFSNESKNYVTFTRTVCWQNSFARLTHQINSRDRKTEMPAINKALLTLFVFSALAGLPVCRYRLRVGDRRQQGSRLPRPQGLLGANQRRGSVRIGSIRISGTTRFTNSVLTNANSSDKLQINLKCVPFSN
jgi:hypothetical protein